MSLRHGTRVGALLAAFVGGVSTYPAWADDVPISEIRVGVAAHDTGLGGVSREEGVAINGVVFFDNLPRINSAPNWLAFLLAPRPHVGGSINTSGDTSYGFVGATWDFNITDLWFVDISLGGAVHSGNINEGDPMRQDLGCRVLFREELSVGFRITERVNISANIEHISNAGLCSINDGLTNAGGRLGIRL